MSSITGALQVEWKYSDDFKRVYMTNSWTMVTDYDARIVFGLVGPAMQNVAGFMPKGEGKYEIEVIMPLRTLKELAISLNNTVKDAESRFGEIKLPK
jgi:hypothetical protein